MKRPALQKYDPLVDEVELLEAKPQYTMSSYQMAGACQVARALQQRDTLGQQ